jgi:hypothetical protein
MNTMIRVASALALVGILAAPAWLALVLRYATMLYAELEAATARAVAAEALADDLARRLEESRV